MSRERQKVAKTHRPAPGRGTGLRWVFHRGSLQEEPGGLPLETRPAPFSAGVQAEVSWIRCSSVPAGTSIGRSSHR